MKEIQKIKQIDYKCADRACNLWTTAAGGTCETYVSSGCLSNGDFCYAKNTCDSYTIPDLANKDADQRENWCNSMVHTANNYKCTYLKNPGTATACKVINTCEEVVGPTTFKDCYLQSGLQTCYFNSVTNKCYTISATNCTDYKVAGVAENQRSAFCNNFRKDDADGILTPCKYHSVTSSTTCINKTCADITTPTSQASCNEVPGCIDQYDNHFYYIYFKGATAACYEKKACTAYTAVGADNDTKRLYCQNMIDLTGGTFCSFTNSGSNCADPAECTAIDGADAATCNKYRDSVTGLICTWASPATKCSLPADDGTRCSLIASGVTSNYDCDIRTKPNICVQSTSACARRSQCSDQTGSNLATCQALLDDNGEYCTWTADSNCEDGKATCADWTGGTFNNLAACSNKKDKTGKSCTWKTGTTCSNFDCTDAQNPQSQYDCDAYMAGCKFYKGTCVKQEDNCNKYTAYGATDDEKLAYCNGRTDSTASPNTKACTYLKGASTCINKGACTDYTPTGADADIKNAACKSALTTDLHAAGCINKYKYYQIIHSFGYTGYTGSAVSTDCLKYKNSTGKTCQGVTGDAACSTPATCDAVRSPTDQQYCDNMISNCLFYQSKCITKGGCTTYATGGTGAISYCKGIKNASGNFCTASSDTAANCIERNCSDTETQYFTTHAECQNYSSLCKSDGLGCVLASLDCTSQTGDLQSCGYYLDSNLKNTCTYEASATASTCQAKTCDQNVSAKSQSDCDNYLSGCLWRGQGCTDKTTTCDKYRGTKDECSNFVGNDIKCWGDSASRGACRDRKCEDKTTAVDDNDCKEFFDDCIFNGVGCVKKSSPCTSFKGNQDGKDAEGKDGTPDCTKFKGNNGANLCWSTSKTVASCVNRECTHLTSKKNEDCEAFLPKNNCITDGTTCIKGPKECKDFKGTVDTCSTFKASNGPCEPSAITATAVACRPRNCYEAPNNYTTDDQCKLYHPNCRTNGRGCEKIIPLNYTSCTTVTTKNSCTVKGCIWKGTEEQGTCEPVIECNHFQSQTSCSARQGCLWANQCRASLLQTQSCDSLTSSGQSICVSNQSKKCYWYNGKCREPTCADFDATLITHESCQTEGIKYSTTSNQLKCTTTGAGCVNLSTCNTYKPQFACEAATTTDTSKRCTWSAGACRQRICTDEIKATSDEECNKFLAGCKTSGNGCVGPKYGCNVFNGNQKFCLQDSDGLPCLYVDGVCYNYAECTDITQTGSCDKFSPLCIAGQQNCRALNQCKEYKDEVSCLNRKGINDTVCGWLPNGTCDTFSDNCSAALGIVNFIFQFIFLIEPKLILQLIKQLCQHNLSGYQNNVTKNSKEVMLLLQKVFRIWTDCSKWNSKCVSDGTNCVPIGDCTSYTKILSCENNVDSDKNACQWTGTNCRLKQCSDKVGATDGECFNFKVKEGICTTNGTNCVLRGTCTSYNSKDSCTYGTDGIQCNYDIPTGQTQGTCRQIQCTDFKDTSNDKCLINIFSRKCVTNGTNCIPQAACSSYKNKLSCQGGGTDGICTFKGAPTATDPNAGTCTAFTSCDTASGDKTICERNPACKYTAAQKCEPTDCVTMAKGGKCNPIPSFDGKTFTICTLTNGICTIGDPTTIPQPDCYSPVTKYAYTWNESTAKCQSCKGGSTPSTNNSTNGNQTNNGSSTTTDNGYILGVTVIFTLLGIFA